VDPNLLALPGRGDGSIHLVAGLRSQRRAGGTPSGQWSIGARTGL